MPNDYTANDPRYRGLQKAESIGPVPEPSWWQKLADFSMGVDSSKGYEPTLEGRINENLGPMAAVMLPFLRGRKALQTKRLGNVQIPGPAQEVLEHYKQRYPRLMSHITNTAEGGLPHPSVTGGMKTGYMYKPDGPEIWKAQLKLNQNYAQSADPALLHNTVRHELAHLAQSISNKKGTPATKGIPFAQAYSKINRNVGYHDNPYEIAASRAGVKGMVQHILGDKWNKIPAKDRNAFVSNVHSNFPIKHVTDAQQMVALQGGATNLQLSQARDKWIRDTYESYMKHLGLTP